MESYFSNNLTYKIDFVNIEILHFPKRGEQVAKAYETLARPWREIPFNQVNIENGFWSFRMKANKETTIPVCLDQCESTGRISNFTKAAGRMDGAFEGIFFNDSDLYKVLEGVAYSLMNHPDPDLEARADRIIDDIAAAQEEDGYLFTYFTLEAPHLRWTDMDKHEMYCGGHLIEAAIAYKQATGKRVLLDVACRLADHYDAEFGPGKRHWVDGHEEVELALIKLYRETGEKRYHELALWLLEERGHGHGHGENWNREGWGAAFSQDDKPVREQREVSGHAVRAMYLYAAMTDIVAINGDESYIEALHHLWESVATRNMYLTGGIGSSAHNEGFTADYDLPNDSAYCETCASIGMVLWNHRMNLLHGDAKYADVVERAMYNGAIAGVSTVGDRFFYVNPLASTGDHHRVAWYDCSCCPTQLARFVPSIGNYVYATSDKGLVVNQFIQGKASVQVGKQSMEIQQQTNYPWDGKVDITVGAMQEMSFELKLRFPGWCKSMTLAINGVQVKEQEFKMENGYVKLDRQWREGDTLTLELEMPVKPVHARAEVKVNEGRVALERGPLVYCVEQVDNAHWGYDEFILNSDMQWIVRYAPNELGGMVKLLNGGTDEATITAVPYCNWDNREPGFMQVWLRERLVESLYS